jgi:hypothetical protein
MAGITSKILVLTVDYASGVELWKLSGRYLWWRRPSLDRRCRRWPLRPWRRRRSPMGLSDRTTTSIRRK